MSLFQESIIRKHLVSLDQEVVDKAYLRFKEVYSANKITNIKVAKEEQYQEGFIKDIFGAVLGYSVFPEQPFNIQTEKKNVADSKKADGAIFQGDNVVGVIELKDNKTKNLDAVKDQAFGYKNNHKDCSYVISSNFHKLRFYVDDATEYEEFDLYNLDKETFKRFYLYLRKEGLLDKNIPKLLRQETKFHEENITKNLYKDYSSFKNNFFQNVVENNPKHDKLLLFKKSQKFLDKVLFVLFAEDKGLVTTNSIVQIVEKWQDLKNDAFDTPKPLYQLVALFFNNLFIGKKDQEGSILVPEFGGEIFAPDDVLDTLIVDDAVLKNDLLKLSKYDFNTDVDVNILGHIFEHSLSEIEEVEAELKGEIADKTKGKRKKDGVFYTPKYITKYIVENTIGKLCSEKKEALKLDVDIDIFEYKKVDGKLNANGIALYENLTRYKTWLLTLKILDPACGSGAFLNQAVNFLVQEHQFIDDIIAELTNTPLRLFDTDIAILENNIYGVDINEESIEIAKLSLWLRTAKQGRKLSNLSNNIKCGNSLIDEPLIAGDKAFNWQNEFPDVFEKGGFDVVIGNPPYLRVQGLKEHYFDLTKFYEKNYVSATGNYDIYVLFLEKSFTLINKKGIVSFILPHKFLVTDFGCGIRKFFKEKTAVEKIIHFGSDLVFEEAATYTCIINLTTTFKDKILFKKINPNDIYNLNTWDVTYYKNLSSVNWDLQGENVFALISKLQTQPYKVEDVFSKVFQGIATGGDRFFTIELIERNIDRGIFYSDILGGNIELEFGLLKPIIKGNQIYRYKHLENNLYTLYPYNKKNNKIEAIEFSEIESKYPLTAIYYKKNYEFLKNREGGRFNNEKEWFLFSRNQGMIDTENPKIMTQEISLGCNMTYDENGIFYHPTTIYSFVKNSKFKVDEKYYLGILNSKVMWFFLKNTGTELGGGYFRFKTNYLKPFPLPRISDNSQFLVDFVNSQLQHNKELQEINQKFHKSLIRRFKITDISKILQDWYLVSYSKFLKELGKKKIILTLNEEAEWETFFVTEAKIALELKMQIEKTDKQIDQMVYQLYDLSEDEIKIIEGN
jgi:hypothetical protein